MADECERPPRPPAGRPGAPAGPKPGPAQRPTGPRPGNNPFETDTEKVTELVRTIQRTNLRRTSLSKLVIQS